MRLLITALSVLCLTNAALSAIVPGGATSLSGDGKDSATAVNPIFAAAAARSIDLTKVPAWEAVPALNLTPIRPGEGLPTLEELGVTWADLVKLPLPQEHESKEKRTVHLDSPLEKRYTPQCAGWSGNLFDYWHALWCYNYLKDLGSTPCTANAHGNIRMCWAPDLGSWHGWSISGTSQTSTCANVAEGGLWVLNNCKFPGLMGWDGYNREGTNAAWGNGMHIVHVGWD